MGGVVSVVSADIVCGSLVIYATREILEISQSKIIAFDQNCAQNIKDRLIGFI
jgi:hypothetical protein